MFVYDVETLGKNSNAVILSMACVYFDVSKRPSYQELVNSAFFVKLDAEDQIKRLKRTVTKSSIEWWHKQCHNAKVKSVIPSEYDVKIEDGIEMMRQWSKQFPNNDKCTVWARGNLDQLVLDYNEEQFAIEPVFFYNRWRDVRTAVDFMTNSSNGYCEVDYPGFDMNMVTKHDPVDDCALDAMMLMYGKIKE
jgi:hypothetical protein